ncbi:MAG: ribosomal protein S18-alanine N-acetyltransferase [Lachnospiraceae bacterium]|nr:ribosomal protein S18-alanine N-acetyltransferase [Lachnospiraceae bacterium]
MEYEIDQMKPEDVREVAALEAKIFSVPWSEAGFLSSLQSEDTLYLAVRKSGKLIAYCGLLQSLDEADITNVAVEESCRGCGIASRMLGRLMELGKARGIVRYTLEVRVSNASAIHVYEKLGFHSVGIRKNFYDRPKEDAMIMWTEDSF